VKLRNTVLMAIVLVVLAGFVYFYEIRGREAREEAERIENLLLDFDADSVEGVTLETSGGLVELARGEGGWRIVRPYALAADDTAVDNLLRQLAFARQERLVVEGAEDLVPFGLDAPPVLATLLLDDGETLSLQVGGGTPVGYNVYVMRGDQRDVYMTPAALKDSLDKSLFDLRDKQVLAFEDSEVEGVDIVADTYEVSLRREAESAEGGAGEWRITAPSAARADADAVSTALRRLRTERATAFVAEQPSEEEIEAFGLAAPLASFTVWTAGDASQTIDLGVESGEPSGVFARRRGNDSVFIIPESLFDVLIPDGINDLRNRSLVQAARNRITAFELDQGGQGYRLERRGDEWRIADPRDLEADASGVSNLLTSFLNLRAEGFAEGGADDPEYGLEAPELTVAAHLNPQAATETAGEPDQASPEDQRREVLLLRVGAATEIDDDTAGGAAAPSEETDEAEEPEEPRKVAVRYVAFAGDPTVYLVRETAIAPFRVDLFDLRAKTLVSFAQEELTRLEVVSEGALYDLEKRGESWIRTGQQEGQIEPTRISDLLWNLNYLRMEGLAIEWDAAAPPPDLAAFGLDTPLFRITAYVNDQVAADVRIGRPVPAEVLEGRAETAAAEQVYALVGNRPAVFQIGRRLSDAVESLASALATGS